MRNKTFLQNAKRPHYQIKEKNIQSCSVNICNTCLRGKWREWPEVMVEIKFLQEDLKSALECPAVPPSEANKHIEKRDSFVTENMPDMETLDNTKDDE